MHLLRILVSYNGDNFKNSNRFQARLSSKEPVEFLTFNVRHADANILILHLWENAQSDLK